MLVPALSRKEELEKLFSIHLYDKDMLYFNAYPYWNCIPDFTPEKNEYRWAIVDDDRVVGYLAYSIDVNADSVHKFALYSFERKNPLIGIDLLKKMKELVTTHRRVEWGMTEGNPVQKYYDKFCERYNGNKVILHNVTKDANGVFRNVHIYEIYKQ